MQMPRFRLHLLALVVAVSLGSVCLPAQAMTSDQALALVKSAYLQKDATALAQLRAAAQSGDANAQFWLGAMYNLGQGVPQDYAQAASWFRKAAEQGNADAQYGLGDIYEHGQGVPQDYAQAASWFRKAAEQGNAYAQFNLGNMYRQGQGVPQDYAQALSWLRKAAEQGIALAQNNLGTMYQFGIGVPQDSIVAYALFNLSASGDSSSDNKAANNRSKVAARLTPQQIAAGQELTRRMMKIGVLKAIDSWR